jgi:hypothetical protein
MNFFEQQCRAKRRSVQLVILMFLAVLGLILVSCMLLILPFSYGKTLENMASNWQFFATVATLVTGVVLLGGLIKYVELTGVEKWSRAVWAVV